MASMHFADRLLDAVRARRTPGIVALDPVYELLPMALRGQGDSLTSRLAAIRTFSHRVLQVIAEIVPAVKINSAFLERYYAEGMGLYHELLCEAANLGLIVIGDIKRGDVGHTAGMYAAGHVKRPDLPGLPPGTTPDAVTISGYFGIDGTQPFIDAACADNKGLFVLVRTSNPSAAVIQDALISDGRRVHDLVAGEVANWASAPRSLGLCGYSCVGAVVATRNRADSARLRSLMPNSLFLVPGYGAQGGKADDFRPYFKADGTGAIIAAGRSIIFAHDRAEYEAMPWDKAIDAACREFAADVAALMEPI